MVTYQFEIDAETWRAWKETVPRTKTLDRRIVELIEADTEGRVLEREEATDDRAPDAGRHAGDEHPLADAQDARDNVVMTAEAEPVESPTDDDRADHGADSGPTIDDAREAVADLDLPTPHHAAVLAAWKHLRDAGQSRRAAFIDEVYEEAPAGYDTRDLKSPERAWWKNVVDPNLRDLPGVDPPGKEGGHWWHWTGNDGDGG